MVTEKVFMERVKNEGARLYGDGALVVDKPAGWTSADVVRRLKRLLNVRRIGHAGTLDPLATGILVVLFGRATRLQAVFLESAKSYEGRIKIGSATDSDDVTGTEIANDTALLYLQRHSLTEWEELIIKKFTGSLLQRPPAYSAIRIEGQRSYDLARRGEARELQPRMIEVHSLEIRFVDERTLEYKVSCSKGTYVRSLARDIGEFLGSFASLESIRRTSAGPFTLNEAVSMPMLEAAFGGEPATGQEHIIPLSKLVSHLPSVALTEADCVLLHQGVQRPLDGLQLPPSEGLLAAIRNTTGGIEGIIERTGTADRGWKVRFMLGALQ